jgi:hypothetical protein
VKDKIIPVPKPVKAPKKKRKRIPLKKKSEEAQVMDEMDDLWNAITHARWGDICAVEGCGRIANQPHHFFSRKNHSVRWYIDNGVWLCFTCHIRQVHQEGNTELAREALIKKIGLSRFILLRETSRTKEKWPLFKLIQHREKLREILKTAMRKYENNR